MATNVVAFIANMVGRKASVHFLGAAGIGAVDEGNWIDCRGMSKGTLHISGITTATVQIHGHNGDSKPADTVDSQMGSDITADGLYEINPIPKYMKVSVEAHTTAQVIANMVADRN